MAEGFPGHGIAWQRQKPILSQAPTAASDKRHVAMGQARMARRGKRESEEANVPRSIAELLHVRTASPRNTKLFGKGTALLWQVYAHRKPRKSITTAAV